MKLLAASTNQSGLAQDVRSLSVDGPCSQGTCTLNVGSRTNKEAHVEQNSIPKACIRCLTDSVAVSFSQGEWRLSLFVSVSIWLIPPSRDFESTVVTLSHMNPGVEALSPTLCGEPSTQSEVKATTSESLKSGRSVNRFLSFFLVYLKIGWLYQWWESDANWVALYTVGGELWITSLKK